MKKLVSILLSIMLIMSALTCVFTVSAAEATPVWDGTANIQWYLDGPNADGAYELKTAEDLAGLAFIVNAGIGDGRYKGVYYVEGGDVKGYVPGKSDNALWDTSLIPTDFTGLKMVDGDTFSGKKVALTADVVLNEGDASTWSGTSVPTNVWQPIGGNIEANLTDYRAGFDGTFDGQGYTISGMYVSPKNSNIMFSGLFGMVGSAKGLGVTIKNLTLTNFYARGYVVGALVGRSEKYCGIENVKVTNGTVEVPEGKTVGGAIAGGVQSAPCSFKYCAVENVKVQGNKNMGIFTGQIAWNDIDLADCYVKNSSVKGVAQVGVLSGRMALGNINIQNLYAANVELEATGDQTDDASASKAGAGMIYGVAGDDKTATIRKVDGYFFNGTVKGAVVNEYGADRVTVLQLSQMNGETAKVFMAGYDYENIWKIVEGDTPIIELRGDMIDQGGDSSDDEIEFLPEPDDEDDEEDEEAGTTPNKNDKNDKNNKNDKTETTAAATEATADEGKSGCGGVVGFSGLMLTAILAGAAVMLKKED